MGSPWKPFTNTFSPSIATTSACASSILFMALISDAIGLLHSGRIYYGWRSARNQYAPHPQAYLRPKCVGEIAGKEDRLGCHHLLKYCDVDVLSRQSLPIQ